MRRPFPATASQSTIKHLAWCAYLCVAFASTVARAEAPGSLAPVITDQYLYYTLDAGDLIALRQQLLERQPRSRSGGLSIGLTDAVLETHYDLTATAHGCRLEGVSVQLAVTTRLPQWHPARRASSELRQRWETFREAIGRHEAGHRDNAIQAATQLLRGLRSADTRLSCRALGRQLERIRSRALLSNEIRDDVYDLRTRNGVAQGSAL
ncbi:MAG: DUF922 domain-containing protein [Arenimonas sp.]